MESKEQGARSRKQRANGSMLYALCSMPYALCLMLICFLLLHFWSAAGSMQEFPVTLEPLSLFEKSEKIEGDDLKKPHQLTYWPIIPGTDKVWIDGVLKSRDADYTIDYETGRIHLKMDVDPESTIRIDHSFKLRR